MSEVMPALASWLDASTAPRTQDFQRYAQSIANARYVIRRIYRIVDEQARSKHLEPLQHQALLQVYGFGDGVANVSAIADRLDVAPAFASRLIKELERQSLIRRGPLATDRRVTVAEITEAGVAPLREIDDAVHLHVKYFQSQVSDRDRLDALTIFAFYVGLEPDSVLADALRDERQTGNGTAGKLPAVSETRATASGGDVVVTKPEPDARQGQPPGNLGLRPARVDDPATACRAEPTGSLDTPSVNSATLVIDL